MVNAEAAAELYDEVCDLVHSEPIGSLSRRLHAALGDLAHELLNSRETNATDGPCGLPPAEFEPLASCRACQRIVAVCRGLYVADKMHRHKTPAGQWCSVAATKGQIAESNRKRQAAYRRRHQLATLSRVVA